MEHLHYYTAGCILRKIVVLTAIGFAVVFLTGPLIAVVGAILPFLIVGFLVWVVIRTLLLGPLVVGRLVGRTVRGIVRALLAVPLWFGRRLGRGVQRVAYASRRATSWVGGIFWETLYGAAVGALLGLIGGIEHEDAVYRIPVGALIGAVIGALAGATRNKPAQEIPTVVPIGEACHRC